MTTLGQQLQQIRSGKGLSEEEVAAETCIPASIIKALESDNYASFNSVTYLKNFLSTYGRFLEVDISDHLKRFDAYHSDDPEGILAATHKPLEDTAPEDRKERSRSPLILAPVVTVIFIFLCFSLFCLFTKGSLPFAPKQTKQSPEPQQASESVVAQAGSLEVDEPKKVEKPIEKPIMIEPIAEEDDHGAYRGDFQASNNVLLTPKTEVMP